MPISNIYDASFRGVPFEVTELPREFEHTLSIAKVPFSNRTFIDDLGPGVERLPVSAFVYGPDYEQQRDALLSALAQTGAGTLVHPKKGELQAYVESVRVLEIADALDSCTLEINFVTQAQINRVLFEQQVVSAKEQPAASVSAEALAGYQDQLEQLSSAEAINQRRTLPEQITSGLHTLRSRLRLSRQVVTDITSPPRWLGQITSEVLGLARELPRDIDLMAGWRRLYERLQSLSDIFDGAPTPLKQVATVLPASLAVDAATELLSSPENLTTDQISDIAGSTREVIQEAIDALRLTQSVANPITLPVITDTRSAQVAALKLSAAQVTKLAHAAIDQAGLTTKIVHQITTLRALSHEFYGTHERTLELKQINPKLAASGLVLPGMQVTARVR